MRRCHYNHLYFERVHPDAKLPEKREEDGGYDIYPAFDADYFLIHPQEVKMIPTGIKSAFDKNYVILLRERGSTGVEGLSVRAGVIDSGYRGEWFIAINNTVDRPIVICKSNKIYSANDAIYRDYSKAIAQAVLVPVPNLNVKEVKNIEEFQSKRGTGALGSTD